MTSMRISIDHSDPGFDFYKKIMQAGNRVHVYIDGELLPGVVTADEATGEVVVQEFTPQGGAVYQDGCVVYRRRLADVKILVDGPSGSRTVH